MDQDPVAATAHLLSPLAVLWSVASEYFTLLLYMVVLLRRASSQAGRRYVDGRAIHYGSTEYLMGVTQSNPNNRHRSSRLPDQDFFPPVYTPPLHSKVLVKTYRLTGLESKDLPRIMLQIGGA
jgi:hypothetical protein